MVATGAGIRRALTGWVATRGQEAGVEGGDMETLLALTGFLDMAIGLIMALYLGLLLVAWAVEEIWTS